MRSRELDGRCATFHARRRFQSDGNCSLVFLSARIGMLTECIDLGRSRRADLYLRKKDCEQVDQWKK